MSGIQSLSLGNTQLLGLGDSLFAFRQDQFDMARVGHVWVDTTVSTVCSAALLRSLVDLDVLDNQVGGVETLGVGVGFGILEQTEQEFGRLDWVAGLVRTEGFAYRNEKVSQCIFANEPGTTGEERKESCIRSRMSQHGKTSLLSRRCRAAPVSMSAVLPLVPWILSYLERFDRCFQHIFALG